MRMNDMGYASGAVAEMELAKVIGDPTATAQDLRTVADRAYRTPIGGHKMGDRVDALRYRARLKADELDA